MKATKPPTVCPPWPLCHNAMTITADSAQAAMICVSGVIVDAAVTLFCSSRRSALLWRSKRLACAGPAPCSRTMRQASTFSSTM